MKTDEKIEIDERCRKCKWFEHPLINCKGENKTCKEFKKK